MGDVDTPLVSPPQDNLSRSSGRCIGPVRISRSQAFKWVGQVLTRTRGRELVGNFNPLLVGALFREQSSHWQKLAASHVQRVAQNCTTFLQTLLQDRCPKDVHSRLWVSQIQDVLDTRKAAAMRELESLIEEIQSYPINYNHYYTDTIENRRRARDRASLSNSVESATNHDLLPGRRSNHTTTTIDIDQLWE